MTIQRAEVEARMRPDEVTKTILVELSRLRAENQDLRYALEAAGVDPDHK